MKGIWIATLHQTPPLDLLLLLMANGLTKWCLVQLQYLYILTQVAPNIS